MRARLLLLVALSARAVSAHAGWVPDYARLQFAGQTGVLSLGAGYGLWHDRIEPEILYGFDPAFVGGRTIHSLGGKATLEPLRVEVSPVTIYPLLAGFSLHAALGRNYAVIPTGHYWNYYAPSGLNSRYFLGTKVRGELPPRFSLEALSVTLEVGTLEDYFVAYTRNTSTLALSDILSLSLAAQAYF